MDRFVDPGTLTRPTPAGEGCIFCSGICHRSTLSHPLRRRGMSALRQAPPTLLSGMQGITRFGSARKLAARAGLIPTVRGNDRTIQHGHISRQGRPVPVGAARRRADGRAAPELRCRL